jgi:hypothetical protein
MKPARAWVLLPSGRRRNMLDPDPFAWTDLDLAIVLSRTYRWAGYSRWELLPSVAQHRLAVLVMRRQETCLSDAEARRELLHDATEALLGGWDPITPLKPHLGAGFTHLVHSLQTALNHHYDLPAWDDASNRRHKAADRLAAANVAFHVAGWSRGAMRADLEILLDPLDRDPLAPKPGFAPWEPWPPTYAAGRFLAALPQLLLLPEAA